MVDRADPNVAPGTNWSPRIPVGGVILGLGILLGGVGGFLLARNSTREVAPPQPPVAARAERVSTERQIASRRLTGFKFEVFSPFIDPMTVVDGFEPPLVLGPPYEAVNSNTFDTASFRVRLGRVRAVGRSEVCYDANQMRFACGLMGRAALKNLLGQRMVICDRLFLVGSAGDGAVTAECRTDDGLVSIAMVRQGFALPSSIGGDDLETALTQAKAARAGVWAGPYVGPPRDPSVEDGKVTPIGVSRPLAGSDIPAPEMVVRPEPSMANKRANVERGTNGGERRRPSPGTPVPTPPSAGMATPKIPTSATGGVIAGPILPPPPSLADRLGVSPSATPQGNPIERNSSSDR